MDSLELNREKIDRCIKKLQEDYFNSSIVEQTTDATDYNEAIHSTLQFLRLGRWIYIPKKWFTDPSIYPDLVFSDIGRGIAIGEEKHIVQEILTNDGVDRIRLETVNYGNLREIVRELRSTVSRRHQVPHLILFAPIDYFVIMHVDWAREENLALMQGGNLLVDNLRLKVFWSSKYVEFDEFIVTERSICRWVAKPNVRDRLEVQIVSSENQPENMELKAQTVFNFTVLNPEEIKVLQPIQRPQI